MQDAYEKAVYEGNIGAALHLLEAKDAAQEKTAKQQASVIYLLAAAPLMIWRAWTLQFVWFWFVLPIFGITVPSLALMIGLDIFVSAYRSSKGSMTSEEIYRALWAGVAYPALIFVFAWFTHLFV